MRKALSVVLAGILVTIFCSLTLAEEKKESMMGKDMMKDCMMGEEGMMMDKGKIMGMDNMCGMMMNSGMMGNSLVATSDGGVIVRIGNKLQKYNKDLVLKKEVRIKMDMEGKYKMMMQMKEKSSKPEKMMEGGIMGGAMEESKEK